MKVMIRIFVCFSAESKGFERDRRLIFIKIIKPVLPCNSAIFELIIPVR